VSTLQHALSIKSRELSALLSSRRGLLASAQQQAEHMQELFGRAQQEIQEWMRMTEEMSRKIDTHKQHRCKQCGLALSPQTANTMCDRAPPAAPPTHMFRSAEA
jgi:hypothetical protein